MSCSFNDDIQGTASVTVGTLIAASRGAGSQLSEQKIVFLGAGSAGCGIAEQIIAQIQREGLSEEEARKRVFMVDRFGLLTDAMPNLLPFQSKLVQKREHLQAWDTTNDVLSLLDVVRNVKPDILIGVSGQPGLFTEEIIREMHKHCPRPIVMPLSNPTSRVEATPQNILSWTDGGAGRHRQPVRPGHPQRQTVRYRPVQQLLYLPGNWSRRYRFRRIARHR
jgi:malate dehydrogenase (oxaloacetate-decarboxylating)